jgi:hypothetical protein
VIPAVPALKQQQDTIATLAELARLGIIRPTCALRCDEIQRNFIATNMGSACLREAGHPIPALRSGP